MGRVFVAGSINMAVVATADRHPRLGRVGCGERTDGIGRALAVAVAGLEHVEVEHGRVGNTLAGTAARADSDEAVIGVHRADVAGEFGPAFCSAASRSLAVDR